MVGTRLRLVFIIIYLVLQEFWEHHETLTSILSIRKSRTFGIIFASAAVSSSGRQFVCQFGQWFFFAKITVHSARIRERETVLVYLLSKFRGLKASMLLIFATITGGASASMYECIIPM